MSIVRQRSARSAPVAMMSRPGTQWPRLPAAAHRNRTAFALALVTALLWGLLPLALRILVPVLDAFTITWCRFLVAAALVGLFLARRGALPNPRQLAPRLRWLLPLAVIGMTANYAVFVVGVRLTSPATAQVVAQLANFFLLFAGLLVFHERFNRLQWAGVAILIMGLALFFNRRLPQLLVGGSAYAVGVGLLVLGALAWAGYSLAQKRLLQEWTSAQLLWLLYVGGAVVLTPLVHPSRLLGLSTVEYLALAFCCLNTIIAYGAYAEAMHLGEVARVSATVTISPLFTLLAGMLAAGWLPPSAVEHPNLLNVLGAGAVVGGSALCALGAKIAAGSNH